MDKFYRFHIRIFSAHRSMKKLLFILIFAFAFCLIYLRAISQPGLTKGDAIENIEIKKILNYPTSITSFSSLQNKIIIVDFFGTWCVPCVKALPHLTEIKKKFKDDVGIVLISNETEAQLTKFIKARTNFLFPVIVDENNQWNNLFKPPSLPYTIVINKLGKIIDITEAEAITETVIQHWLFNAEMDTLTNTVTIKKESKTNVMIPNQKSDNKIVALSQDFIYLSKTGETINDLFIQLKNLNYQTLLTSLNTDNAKKAFWINLYNGQTQTALKNNPGKYKNRNAFYKEKQIEIAGNKFSLDDIEHGILRHSKIKWSLGLFNKLFPSKIEKQLRVHNLDYRIHFALNCGAKSCPPIAFYNPETINEQLEIAVKAYLTSEAAYDNTNNIIKLPTLMSWFRADFGGKKGMIKILKQYNIIAANVNPKIKFKKYDWTLSLNNYTN